LTGPLPLFPLQTVLFPGGRLPLRIFEARYLDLVSRCLRDEAPFGICLIRHGTEAGAPPEFFPTGTSARIVDWGQLADGLLGITVQGERRFRVLTSSVAASGLVRADVEWCEELPVTLSQSDLDLGPLQKLLLRASDSMALPYPISESELHDPGWLSFRLAELMPDLGLKQMLLQMNSWQERLAHLRTLLVSSAITV
jgi:hypothetical protein